MLLSFPDAPNTSGLLFLVFEPPFGAFNNSNILPKFGTFEKTTNFSPFISQRDDSENYGNDELLEAAYGRLLVVVMPVQ